MKERHDSIMGQRTGPGGDMVRADEDEEYVRLGDPRGGQREDAAHLRALHPGRLWYRGLGQAGAGPTGELVAPHLEAAVPGPRGQRQPESVLTARTVPRGSGRLHWPNPAS